MKTQENAQCEWGLRNPKRRSAKSWEKYDAVEGAVCLQNTLSISYKRINQLQNKLLKIH